MVQAAIEAFAEQGYHATTTRDIAARAGLSPAALYVHYPSKAALLGQISRVGHEAALALVEEAAGAADDPRGPVERLCAVASSFTAWHARHHRMARVIQYELGALLPQDRGAVVAVRRRIERVLEEIVAQGAAAGAMSTGGDETPRALSRAILSLGIDVARWYDPSRRESPEHLGRLYADLAARMVGAAPQGPAPQGPAPQGPAPQGPAPQGPAPQGPAPQGPAP